MRNRPDGPIQIIEFYEEMSYSPINSKIKIRYLIVSSFRLSTTVRDLVSKLPTASESQKETTARRLLELAIFPENQLKMTKVPGLLAGLTELLISGNDKAKEYAAAALYNLAMSPENKVTMPEVPGLLAGLTGLLTSGDDKAKEYAAAALRILAIVPESRTKMTKVPGLLAGLTDLLRSGNDKAKEYAAWALSILAMSPENQVKLAEFPGLLAGLTDFLISGSELAKAYAAAALFYLAFCSQSRTKMAEFRGLLAGLTDLLRSGSELAKEYAAAALSNLAMSPGNRTKMAEVSGLLEGLTELLISGSEIAKDYAERVLEDLATDHETNKGLVLQALVHKLSHDSDDERLFNLFSRLGGAPAVVDAIVSLSDTSRQIPLINKVLSKKIGDEISLFARLFWEGDEFKDKELLELLRSTKRAAAPRSRDEAMAFHGAGAPAGGGSAGASDKGKALEVERLYKDIRLKKNDWGSDGSGFFNPSTRIAFE